MKIIRKTKETKIFIKVFYKKKNIIKSGIPFFDHLLNQTFFHSGIGIKLLCKGDLEIDYHHSIEDIGIALGKLLRKILKKKKINRFNFSYAPLDESLSRIILDVSGRGFLLYNVFIKNKYNELILEFFKSFCLNAKVTMHIDSIGNNGHHIFESIFKCFGNILKNIFLIKKCFLSTKW
ncbi:imidazoleglycerol-phosphate dehydratase HisB [Candidatus Vidania fulgoroideorum]